MSAKSMLAEARKWLGTSGRPNALTKAYAARNGAEFLRAPWCNISVTEWSRRSGNAAAVLPHGDRAYTVWHAQDGERLGRWHAGTVANIKKHAKPGAIVFFDWGGTDEIPKIDHVGIIEKVLDDGRVQTIEGNTDDACKRRVRSASVIAGFWNPPYEEDDMPLTDADVKKIVAAVYDRLTHEVPPDVWAAREGILTPGQKIDPRTAFRQTWAYTKDGYHRLREILAKLDAQNAAIKALADALAAQNAAIDADALVERIRAEIASIRVRLVADDPA